MNKNSHEKTSNFRKRLFENIIEKRQENRFWQSEEAIKINFFALKANMEYCILF